MMKLGDLKKEKTSSKFSEKYMRGIYEPIMKLFGWNWNSKNLEKMVSLNWLLLLVLLWIYCFFSCFKAKKLGLLQQKKMIEIFHG